MRTSPLLTLRSSSNSIIRYAHLGLFTVSLSMNQPPISRCREGLVALDEISRRLDRARKCHAYAFFTARIYQFDISRSSHGHRKPEAHRRPEETGVRRSAWPRHQQKIPLPQRNLHEKRTTRINKGKTEGLEMILMTRTRGSRE